MAVILCAALELSRQRGLAVGFPDYEESMPSLFLDWLLYTAALTVSVLAGLALLRKLLDPHTSVSFTSIGADEVAVREVVRASRIPRRALPLSPRLLLWGWPRWALLMATVLTFCIFVAVNFVPQEHYSGLWVYLVGSRITVNSISVQSDGIVLQVKRGKTPSATEIWIDSSLITEQSLPTVLRDRLKDRPGWSVYIDGDANLDFKDVAHVIDLIAGVPAKVVLLQPRQRHQPRR